MLYAVFAYILLFLVWTHATCLMEHKQCALIAMQGECSVNRGTDKNEAAKLCTVFVNVYLWSRDSLLWAGGDEGSVVDVECDLRLLWKH